MAPMDLLEIQRRLAHMWFCLAEQPDRLEQQHKDQGEEADMGEIRGPAHQRLEQLQMALLAAQGQLVLQMHPEAARQAEPLRRQT